MDSHLKEAVLLAVAGFFCVASLVVLFTGMLRPELAAALLLAGVTASWAMVGNMVHRRHRR